MKLKLLTLICATTIATTAFAGVPGSTIGVRGGYAFGQTTDGTYVKSADDTGVGYGLFFEQHFNENIGLFAGYNQFDGLSAKYKNSDYDYKIYGPEVAARFAIPLDANGSDVFFKAGAMYALTDADGAIPKDRRLAPVVGFGAQYQFENGLGLRAGLDYYFNAYRGDGIAEGADVDMGFAYVGLQYHFGHKEAAPTLYKETTTEVKSYVLDANTLFGFDSASISNDGKQAIVTMLKDVAQSNLQNLKFEVNGYSDRIGNEAYNQKLSEKRAQAVTDTLIENNVSPETITTTGYGIANPVTGDKCTGLKRADLIKCYAEDRRVEINVKGETVSEQTKTKEIPSQK